SRSARGKRPAPLRHRRLCRRPFSVVALLLSSRGARGLQPHPHKDNRSLEPGHAERKISAAVAAQLSPPDGERCKSENLRRSGVEKRGCADWPWRVVGIWELWDLQDS